MTTRASSAQSTSIFVICERRLSPIQLSHAISKLSLESDTAHRLRARFEKRIWRAFADIQIAAGIPADQCRGHGAGVGLYPPVSHQRVRQLCDRPAAHQLHRRGRQLLYDKWLLGGYRSL